MAVPTWDLNARPVQAAADDDGREVVGTSKGKAKQQTAPPKHDGARSNHQPPAHGRGGHQNTRSGRPPQHQRGPAKWQNVNGGPTRVEAARGPPRLVQGDDDNDAQEQWRALQPAKMLVRIDIELINADPQRPYIIARQHDAFLGISDRQYHGSDSQVYGIWGAPDDAQAARAAINAWIGHLMGPQSKNGKFAKQLSLTPKLRQRAEKRWKLDVKREQFRQQPRPGTAFGTIGTFLWPVKEYVPHEILGKSCEALDPIRMDCSCYVLFKPEKGAFQVMGPTMEKVKEALLRLRGVAFQIAAKQIAPVRKYLLHYTDDTYDDSYEPREVYLKEYEYPRLLNDHSSQATQPGHVPHGGDFYPAEHGQTAVQRWKSQCWVRRSMLQTLARLRYHRGSVEMRVHLGRFLATQYKVTGDAYEIEEYTSMIKESQFQGLVTNELGDRAVESDALAALQASTDLLVPLNIAVDKLADTEPIYTAIFTFEDQAGDLRLTVSWKISQDPGSDLACSDQLEKKWIRLDRDTKTTTSLLDVSLSDLNTSFGWGFSIDVAQTVDENRLSAPLIYFGNNVKLDSAAARKQSSDRPFVIYNAVPKVRLKSLSQQIRYQYALHEWDYSLEVYRFQDRFYPEPIAGLLPSSTGRESKFYEPRWGLKIYRTEWDAMFAENEKLTIGGVTDWEASSQRFFPKGFNCSSDKESEIFDEWMGVLSKISKLLLAPRGGPLWLRRH